VSISEVSIKRPVFASVLSLVLILIGLISFNSLSVRLYPDINNPAIAITTTYVGANPETVESKLTSVLENAISGINGIKYISSSSVTEKSIINITFKVGTDIDKAIAVILTNISKVSYLLPPNSYDPVVTKNSGAGSPVVVIQFTSSKMNAMDITDFVNRNFIPLIQQVDGVSDVGFFSEKNYAMRVYLKPNKMASRKITVDDVVKALSEQNVDIPSGKIKSDDRYFTVNSNAELTSVQQYREVIVSVKDGYITRLSDIADIKLGSINTQSGVSHQGKEIAAIYVRQQATGNPLVIAMDVKKILKNLKDAMPPGMKSNMVMDQSIYINASINEVYKTVVEAVVLVIIVVFLFLGSMRSSLIPIVTIPVCLVASFGLLALLGYSINTITLLALVLAIGLVVDDAIVMLENIYSHIERGLPPMKAAIKGSKEIAFAVVAMTLTLAAVYVPIGFSTGFTAVILSQFAFTLAGTVIISGFVALTLSPMMCAKILVPHSAESRLASLIDRGFKHLLSAYEHFLRGVIAHRRLIIVILVLLVACGYYLYKKIPSELAPTNDVGYIISLAIGPTDASYEYMQKQCNLISKIYPTIPEWDGNSVLITGFPNSYNCFSMMQLIDWDKRQKSQVQIAQEIDKTLYKIPGVKSFAITPPPLGMTGMGNYDVEMVVSTPGSLNDLNKVMKKLIKAAKKSKLFRNIRPTLRMDDTQFNVIINRSMAYDMGVSLKDISNTISTNLAGNRDYQFSLQGRNYFIYIKATRKSRKSIDVFSDMYVRNNKGQMIPLSRMITIKTFITTSDIPHYDNIRSDTFQANLNEGVSMSDAIEFLKKLNLEKLPSGASYKWTGNALNYLESQGQVIMLFIIAILFIYLVLAAQFESYIDPFVILLSVPLSVIGALFTLFITGKSLNIFSQIGLVTLIGLISKHGILITEFANQLRKTGKSIEQSIVEAATKRLRPILMTTAAMIIGAVPLVIATGAGAANRQPIGWVIVGGMFFGTFFSLVVVPIAYYYLGKLKKI
jgi:multidrug efflux pump